MTPPQHQHQRLPATWTRHVARTSRVHHQPPPHKPSQRSIIHVLLSLCVVFTTVVVVVVVEAKVDRNAPHGHRGKLSPYPPGPFVGLILTKDDEQTLERGDSVMKQTLPTDSHSAGGAAICVQDVHAPITAVWAQILHMEEYPNKVNKVLKCENYQVQEEEEEDAISATATPTNKHVPKKILRIKTKQVLGVLPGYSVRPYHALSLLHSLSLSLFLSLL